MTKLASPVLLAVDRSDASFEAAREAGRLIADDRDAEIYVLTVLPPFPASLLEHGGSSDPADEERLEARQEEARKRHLEQEREASTVLLQRMRKALVKAGVPTDAIHTACEPSDPADRLAHRILHAARERDCQTIVVGRRSLPWYHEMFHRHLGDQLEGLCETENGQQVHVMD